MSTDTTCSCGCSTVATISAAPCACGCECCESTPKTTDEEAAELRRMREQIDRRLSELGT